MSELDQKEGWVLKNWCVQIVVLEKTLESPLDCKESKPVNLKENQSWIFIGKTDAETEAPILWPPDAKGWQWKRPWCWEKWGQEDKGTTEDEMVGWHHWLNGHGFEKTPFNITVIQVYAPTTNAKEAEVERFYKDLKYLLELTPQKDVLFIIGDWNTKAGSQETPGVTANLALEYRMKQGKG